MIFQESHINPLIPLLDSLSSEEWQDIDKDWLTTLSLYMVSGGILCEEPVEVLAILNLLSEYKLIELDSSANTELRIRKINYGLKEPQ